LQYYPRGGLNDLKYSTDNLIDYLDSGEFKSIDDDNYGESIQIWDTTTNRIILTGYSDNNDLKELVHAFISNFNECV
jgi:hypothetical protein